MLQVENLSIAYGKKTVLDNINWRLPKGKIVGLLGKNGAGKTTLLKALAGLHNQYSGLIEINQTPPQDPAYKPKIGYMSERNPLYQNMYVREYMEWILASRKPEKKQNTHALMSAMGLMEVASHPIKTLSKGYRQRVGLAAAMVHNPDVLILDEPVNGLDPAQILQFRAAITSFGHDKLVILSSHLMQEIEALCDEVYLLSEGKLAAVQDFHTTSLQNVRMSLQLGREADKILWDYFKSNYENCISEGKAIYFDAPNKDDWQKELMQTLLAQDNYIKFLHVEKQNLNQLFTQ